MALIGETRGGGNFGERFARAQKLLGPVDSYLVLIRMGRHPRITGKKAMYVKCTEIRQLA
jgi:hypothetical protein